MIWDLGTLLTPLTPFKVKRMLLISVAARSNGLLIVSFFCSSGVGSLNSDQQAVLSTCSMHHDAMIFPQALRASSDKASIRRRSHDLPHCVVRERWLLAIERFTSADLHCPPIRLRILQQG